MSKKNKTGGFENLAARKFADMGEVPKMSQYRIYSILENDMPVMLEQVAKNRAGVKDAKYPAYIMNAFANLATAKYFYKFIKKHVKTKKKSMRTDLSFEQVDALRVIIANAYMNSQRQVYQSEMLDSGDRNHYLLESFKMLDPVRYRIAKKLRVSYDDRRTDSDTKKMNKKRSKAVAKKLIISTFLDPKYEIRKVASLFDNSSISDKKKLKIMRKLYAMTEEEYNMRVERDKRLGADKDPNYIPGPYARFAKAIGWAFTMESTSSDFPAMCISFVSNQKKRNRIVYLMAYAEAFKERKTSNFLLKAEFYKPNKKLIKKLIKMDVGYRKAFDSLKGPVKKQKKDKDAVKNQRPDIKK